MTSKLLTRWMVITIQISLILTSTFFSLLNIADNETHLIVDGMATKYF